MSTKNVSNEEKGNGVLADVSGRFQIRIAEIWQMVERQKEINRQNLSNIDFIDDDGKVIEVEKKIVDEFKFCGLNNCDFITSEFYKGGFETLR